MSKKSIRFYKDHEVRAVWDEEKSTWWFSIVDIVGAITDSPNPRKYWSVLKTRLKKAGNELTTRCSQLKMTAADGKRYATDCFAQDDIIQLVRVIPSKKTEDFLDWFVYSDNTNIKRRWGLVLVSYYYRPCKSRLQGRRLYRVS